MTADEYAALIEKILSTFQYLENKPYFPSHVEIPADNPAFLRWKAEIALQNEIVLRVNEKAKFDDRGMCHRAFSYDLRHRDGRLIWRICNHDSWQPITSSCHVHANPDDSESSIEFFDDSEKTNFPYVIQCVRKFYEGERQDWEEVEPDDTTE